MLEYKMLFLFSDRLLHIQNPFKDKATTGNYSQQSEWQGNTQLFAKALQNFCCCCFCSCFWFSHCQRLSATLLTALSRTLAVQQHSHSPASFMQQFPAQSHITDVTRLLCSLLPNANEMGVRWQGTRFSPGYLRRHKLPSWAAWKHFDDCGDTCQADALKTPNRSRFPLYTHRPLILPAAVWHDDAISIL